MKKRQRLSRAMIAHAGNILSKPGTDFTHRDEDGYSLVCKDCVAGCLKSNWGNRIRKPLTLLQWKALGDLALDLIWKEVDVERDEATIN